MSEESRRGPPSARTRAWLRRGIILVTLATVLVGLFCYVGRRQAKRFQTLREGVCYRVGQPTELGFWCLARVYGVKTILSLRMEDPRLCRGPLDLGEPDGETESVYTARLGIEHRQWPMGDEACWPWVTPWQFDEFFKLFDDPSRLPVAIHCVGGRHRTGIVAALFRLEYDRWPAERALQEMYSFDVEDGIAVPEANLRTFYPRPRPVDAQWQALKSAFAPHLPAPAPTDYQELVYQLRAHRRQAVVAGQLRQYFDERKPFGLALAQRLIDEPADDLAAPATRWADACLQTDAAADDDWAVAAALVADFGSPDEQQRLLDLLAREPHSGLPSARYQGIVAGVTNRYTPNRIAYLLPLLDDGRPRPEPDARRFRYCDTAAARLSVMLNQNLVERMEGTSWDQGCQRARDWFAAHPNDARLSQLRPPAGCRAAGEPGELDRPDNDLRGER